MKKQTIKVRRNSRHQATNRSSLHKEDHSEKDKNCSGEWIRGLLPFQDATPPTAQNPSQFFFQTLYWDERPKKKKKQNSYRQEIHMWSSLSHRARRKRGESSNKAHPTTDHEIFTSTSTSQNLQELSTKTPQICKLPTPQIQKELTKKNLLGELQATYVGIEIQKSLRNSPPASNTRARALSRSHSPRYKSRLYSCAKTGRNPNDDIERSFKDSQFSNTSSKSPLTRLFFSFLGIFFFLWGFFNF